MDLMKIGPMLHGKPWNFLLDVLWLVLWPLGASRNRLFWTTQACNTPSLFCFQFICLKCCSVLDLVLSWCDLVGLVWLVCTFGDASWKIQSKLKFERVTVIHIEIHPWEGAGGTPSLALALVQVHSSFAYILALMGLCFFLFYFHYLGTLFGARFRLSGGLFCTLRLSNSSLAIY